MAEPPRPKKLRCLVNLLKDKTSLILAVLSFKRASSIYAPVLRATTHDFSVPPSEEQISAILYLGHDSGLTASACVDALMDRLHQTRSATVALKCLFTVHILVAKGSSVLREQLSYYPFRGGHNFLNFSMFCDNSDADMFELSSWVRWYAGVLEQSIMVTRVLSFDSKGKKGVQENLTRLPNSDLLDEIEALVGFVQKINQVPDSLHLQRNDLVYEVVKMVGEDYRWVQYEIFTRVVELGSKVENLDSDKLTKSLSVLEMLENSKERLTMLFVNKNKNEDFWELVGQTKGNAAVTKKQREEKRLVEWQESRKAQVSWSPFLEPGQVLPWPPCGGWLGADPLALTVSTVR